MEIHHVSRRRYAHTIKWAVCGSVAVVVIAAGVGRATLNLRAAVTEKPDIAIYMLLPEEEIGKIEILRESETQRDYLAETKDGPKLIILKRGEEKWYVELVEPLRE